MCVCGVLCVIQFVCVSVCALSLLCVVCVRVFVCVFACVYSKRQVKSAHSTTNEKPARKCKKSCSTELAAHLRYAETSKAREERERERERASRYAYIHMHIHMHIYALFLSLALALLSRSQHTCHMQRHRRRLTLAYRLYTTLDTSLPPLYLRYAGIPSLSPLYHIRH